MEVKKETKEKRPDAQEANITGNTEPKNRPGKEVNTVNIENKRTIVTNGHLISGSLTFLSILLGIFTFSLVNAIEYKDTYPEAYAWYSLTLISGVSILLSGLICAISFFYHGKLQNRTVELIVIVLFAVVLIICGFGIPFIGLWVFLSQ